MMRGCVWMVIAALLAMGGIGQGAVYVDVVQVGWENFGGIAWYNVTSGEMIVPGQMAQTVTLSLFGQSGAQYRVSNAVFSMTCAMVDDSTSSGLTARGEFARTVETSPGVYEGVELTLNGELVRYGEAAPFYTGDIFRGVMTFNEVDDTWTITEDNFTHDYSGTVNFQTDMSVGLGLGIVDGAETIRLGDFTSSFNFLNCNDVSNFRTAHLVCADLFYGAFPAQAYLQIDAVPEPGALVLLLFGSWRLWSSKRKM